MANNDAFDWIGRAKQELNTSVERLLKVFIKPSSMLHAFDKMLSAKEKEQVKSKTETKGDMTGAELFFEFLNSKTLEAQEHWRELLLDILKKSDLNLKHVVQLVEDDKEYIKELYLNGRLREKRSLDTDSLRTPSSVYINHNNKMKDHVFAVFTKLEPTNIIYVFKSKSDNILTQRDIENVNAEIGRNGSTKGAELLLERLVLYENWFPVLLDVLRHPDVKCEPQADFLEENTAAIRNEFLQEMETMKNYTRTVQIQELSVTVNAGCFRTVPPTKTVSYLSVTTRKQTFTKVITGSHNNNNLRPSRRLPANVADNTQEYETDGGDVSSVNTQTVDLVPAHRPRPMPQQVYPNADLGKTELMAAAETGQYDRVASLLERGDSVHALDRQGRSALMYAANSGYINCVQRLAESSDVNLHDANGCTALMFAANQGHVNCVQYLISRSSINEQDNDGCTALFHAARGVGRNFECMQALVEAGADPDLINSRGKTALMVAASSDSPDCLNLLLDKAKLINNVDQDGDTALMAAARFGSTECVKVLLLRLPDQQYINQQNRKSLTALMMAAENGYSETLQLLINAKCDVNERDETGQSAVMKAAMKGHRKCVSLLCQTEIDVNKTDQKGRSAVIFAAAKGKIECLLLLAGNRANLDQPDNSGNTALMFAACHNQLECVKFLIEREVNVTAINNQKKTALKIAEDKKHWEVVELLQNISRQ